MKIAEELYESESPDVEAIAATKAESQTTKEIDAVEYRTFRFKDKSEITFGSNGLISIEY